MNVFLWNPDTNTKLRKEKGFNEVHQTFTSDDAWISALKMNYGVYASLAETNQITLTKSGGIVPWYFINQN